MASSPTIRTLSELVQFVEENCDGDSILFRGQPADVPLLPKIARPTFVPKHERLKDERQMFDEFRRQALPFLEVQPETLWDWLAIAQHHGMATRLLDWTLNPLAALWFAVERPAVGDAPGVVWMLETTEDDFIQPSSNTDPLSIDRTRVFRPRHLTRRIVAQSGWFTAHKYVDAKGKFVSLNTNKNFKPRLTKLRIPADRFADIRRELDRCGVNASSLYLGIDGLGRHLEWLYSFLPDEVPASQLSPAT